VCVELVLQFCVLCCGKCAGSELCLVERGPCFVAFSDPPVSASYMPFQSDHKVMAHTVNMLDVVSHTISVQSHKSL
jgi:hypothetical protein